MESRRMSSSTSLDPAELLCLAKAGDPSALGHLLELHRNYLLLLARLQIGRRLQGKADAADLVQETFLQAYRNFAQFRGAGEQEFAGWLRQILASRLAKLVRRYCDTRQRDIRLERELAGELDQSSRAVEQGLAARQSSPSRRAIRREQAVLLADALGQLSTDYQEVLVLHHLQGLGFTEVAQRMDKTVASVKNIWARALAQLRRTLEDPP
jgi:RNA polymerase sigma-70 factor, ECF subfamily